MVVIELETTDPNAKLLTRSYRNDAGWDIYSAEKIVIQPRSHGVVKTGVRLRMTDHMFGLIQSRSGLAKTRGVFVTGGVIDVGFEGEIEVVCDVRSIGCTCVSC